MKIKYAVSTIICFLLCGLFLPNKYAKANTANNDSEVPYTITMTNVEVTCLYGDDVKFSPSDFDFDIQLSLQNYYVTMGYKFLQKYTSLDMYNINGTITNLVNNKVCIVNSSASDKTMEQIITDGYNELTFVVPWLLFYMEDNYAESDTKILYTLQLNMYFSITFVAQEESKTIIDISQYTKNINPIELLEDNLPPTLSANNIILDIGTKYDINIENKIKDTTYNWISDNEEIVTVNSKNGVINAISEGTAIITCQMTNGAEISTLSATVNVIKYDDKYPTLTETELELETDDFFDINITNKIKGSKYYWTSSDKTIAKVNSKNGKVTTISEGDVVITCTITTPDNQVFVRKCDVSVVNYSKFEENDIEE